MSLARRRHSANIGDYISNYPLIVVFFFFLNCVFINCKDGKARYFPKFAHFPHFFPPLRGAVPNFTDSRVPKGCSTAVRKPPTAAPAAPHGSRRAGLPEQRPR